MPTNKKESVQFGLLMCFGMVLVMTFYNFYLNGMIGHMTWRQGVSDFLIGFLIAILLDLFLVGPNAKKLAMKITAGTTKQVYTILAISTCMVIGMAALMSIYGVVTYYLHNGSDSTSLIAQYGSIFGKNFILAWPLQIIIMGPLVRFIFTRFVKKGNEVNVAEQN